MSTVSIDGATTTRSSPKPAFPLHWSPKLTISFTATTITMILISLTTNCEILLYFIATPFTLDSATRADICAAIVGQPLPELLAHSSRNPNFIETPDRSVPDDTFVLLHPNIDSDIEPIAFDLERINKLKVTELQKIIKGFKVPGTCIDDSTFRSHLSALGSKVKADYVDAIIKENFI